MNIGEAFLKTWWTSSLFCFPSTPSSSPFLVLLISLKLHFGLIFKTCSMMLQPRRHVSVNIIWKYHTVFVGVIIYMQFPFLGCGENAQQLHLNRCNIVQCNRRRRGTSISTITEFHTRCEMMMRKKCAPLIPRLSGALPTSL